MIAVDKLLYEQREFFVLRPGWAYRREAPPRNLRNKRSAFFTTNNVSSSPRP